MDSKSRTPALSQNKVLAFAKQKRVVSTTVPSFCRAKYKVGVVRFCRTQTVLMHSRLWLKTAYYAVFLTRRPTHSYQKTAYAVFFMNGLEVTNPSLIPKQSFGFCKAKEGGEHHHKNYSPCRFFYYMIKY